MKTFIVNILSLVTTVATLHSTILIRKCTVQIFTVNLATLVTIVAAIQVLTLI